MELLIDVFYFFQKPHWINTLNLIVNCILEYAKINDKRM